jgi:1-acyl-sn-glycerol-3-phosphate acyltransferase
MRLAVLVLKPLLLLFTRHEWRGSHNVPVAGGVILVTNHLSHADPLTFSHFVWEAGRAPRFIAKESLFAVPFVGSILRGARQIPVRRDSADAAEAFSAAVVAVRQGEAVCIYPEATLTRDPQLWPMTGKTGAARVALATGAPVIPIAQWGPQDLLAPYSRRLRLLSRPVIRVAAGAPVDLSRFVGVPVTAEVLQTATREIMDAITVLLVDLRGEERPA